MAAASRVSRPRRNSRTRRGRRGPGARSAATLAASLLIYRRGASRIRPALGLLLLSATPLLLDGVGGVTDSLYGLFLVLYWHCRRHALRAGLVLGLAAATRQQVWFFLPFLLYLGCRGGGWPDLARRSGGMPAVFLACNLPFIVASPGDWLDGMLGPLRDPLFAEGIGLVGLSLSKILPLWPSAVYGGLELLLYALVFAFFTRRYAAAPGLAMILPLLPLAVAWRSLHTYFLLLPLLATAVLADGDACSATSMPPGTNGGARTRGGRARRRRAGNSGCSAPRAAAPPRGGRSVPGGGAATHPHTDHGTRHKARPDRLRGCEGEAGGAGARIALHT